MAVIELTQETFDSAIQDNDLILVDFWAPWCGPCRSFAPVYEKVAAKYPDVAFAKVNTEEERELAAQFQIRSIPTLMILREKVILFKEPGMLPEGALDQVVQQAQALDMEAVRQEIAAQH